MPSIVRVAAVQAEPCWLDLAAGVDQVTDLIGRAAAAGADLVVFPETFLPGYPWWVWLAPALHADFAAAYRLNSMSRTSAEFARIASAAALNGVHVSLGFSERADDGRLYMAQALLDDRGTALSIRRRLAPGHLERTVFAPGRRVEEHVVATRLGRIGGMNCWEHDPADRLGLPLPGGEQLHVGSVPGSATFRAAAATVWPEVDDVASQLHAVDNHTYVVAASALVGPAARRRFLDDGLLPRGGGYARIYGPEGSSFAAPLDQDEEGILCADLDLHLADFIASASRTARSTLRSLSPAGSRNQLASSGFRVG